MRFPGPASPLPGRVEQLEEIFIHLLDERHRDEVDPDFHWYYRGSFGSSPDEVRKGTRRLLREVEDNLRLAGFAPENKEVLDAGCGYGLMSVILAVVYGARVTALDSYEPMVETLRRFLVIAPAITGVTPLHASVDRIPRSDESYDFILSNEAISHYYDEAAFLREAARLLRPGGTLLISDANNAANPYIAWRTKKLWARFENGPAGKIFFSEVDTPYVQKRQVLLRESFPTLSEPEARRLAALTFGYTRARLEQAGAAYLRDGTLPDSPFRYGVTPVDPAIDNYQERLIDPRRLGAALRSNGLQPRVMAYMGGASGNRLVRWATQLAEAAGPLAWPLGRVLKIVARKPVV